MALALLASLPLAAPAFDWNGRLALAYGRSDVWTADTEAVTVPALTLDLGLGGHGYLSAPGVFDWRATASYRYDTTRVGDAPSSSSDALTFGLATSLFQNPRSRFSLGLDASRTRREFTQSDDATGDGTLLRYGGGVLLRSGGDRSVQASFHREDSDEAYPGLPDHTRTRDVVRADFLNGVGSFNVNGAYQGEWSDGSWTSDDYDQHFVSVTGTGALSPDWTLLITDSYSRREPTGDADVPGSYALESNAFRAGVQRSDFGMSRTAYYSYSRTLISTAAAANEATSHSLRALNDFQIRGPKLFLRATGDVSQTISRGAMATEATGETLGLDLWWRDAWLAGFDLHGGALFGAIQADPGGSSTGYGATAGGRYLRSSPGALRSSLTYEGSYVRDLYAVQGWTLRHDLQGSLSGDLSTARWTASVVGTFLRSTTAAFGDTASRTLTFNGQLTRGDLTGSISASTSEGVAPGATISGDGLFVPAPFDVRSRSLSLSLAGRVWAGFQALATVHYLVSEAPGAPTLDVLGADASLTYRYGGLDLILRDRITASETVSGRVFANVVELRLSRAFSGRY